MGKEGGGAGDRRKKEGRRENVGRGKGGGKKGTEGGRKGEKRRKEGGRRENGEGRRVIRTSSHPCVVCL